MRRTDLSRVLLILTCSFMISCGAEKNRLMFNETPPNGILIHENFYCDQSEVTNFNWVEYMFWTERVFGRNSKEFTSCLPDTISWLDFDTGIASYSNFYLRHPAYRDYPVVGISQQQALDFSSWRSDRVFEFLLIREELIIYDTSQTSASYFSISRYFNGQLDSIIPNKEIKFYPQFRLPSTEEFMMIAHYSDSVNALYLENCNGKKCRECDMNMPMIRTDVNLNETSEVMWSVSTNCVPDKYHPIFNIRGNAAEWAEEVETLIGGSWRDKKSDVYDEVTTSKGEFFISLKGANATSGFRNVFEWISVDSIKKK